MDRSRPPSAQVTKELTQINARLGACRQLYIAILGLLILIAALHQGSSAEAHSAESQTIPPPPLVRLAIIGDYGVDNASERAVADLVHSWKPDAIVTTGDNNYPAGATNTIDKNIGKYYADYIAPYSGTYTTTVVSGVAVDAGKNRFYPVLGNHDWLGATGDPPLPKPYLDYFVLPEGKGKERYYEVGVGPVQIFAIDSDHNEPDGTQKNSIQAQWLQSTLARVHGAMEARVYASSALFFRPTWFHRQHAVAL